MPDDPQVFTQEQVEAQVQERLAAAKAEGDKAFEKLWEEGKAAKATARTLEAKLAEIEQARKAEKAGVTSDELTRLRGEVRADLEKEYLPLQSQRDTFASENRQLKLDTVVKGLMGKAGVRAERVEALFRLTGDKYDLTDDGKPMLKDRMGTPVEKFLAEELIKEYPEFYQGSGSSGGGAPRSNGGAGGVGRARVIAAPAHGVFDKSFLDNLDGLRNGTTTIGE